MYGPDIIARTISVATVRGKSRAAWQYHGRSDVHSKLACWAVLFDLLDGCDVFRTQAAQGKVSFAVNHLMVGPINKTLDLVVCATSPGRRAAGRRTFAQLAPVFGVQLSPAERQLLEAMPVIHEEQRGDVAEVLIALEAKACMTDLVGSIPRLHAEILATGYLAKQAATSCITISYTLVNGASQFTSPGSATIKNHKQPNDASAVLDMIRRAIPTAHNQPALGYDAIGASLIDCVNDGSPVRIVTSPPAPRHTDFISYDRMMQTLCGVYRHKFGLR